MMKKIIIIATILLLTLNFVAATQPLQIPLDFTQSNMEDIYELKNNKNVQLYIGELKGNELYFENDTGYTTKYDGKYYFFADSLASETGYNEIVDVNGTKYMVTVSIQGKYANNPSDVPELKNYMDQVNDLNSLTPIPF